MTMINDSIMIDVDAYKVSMWLQYPEGTEYVSSYIEARKNPWVTTTWYGLKHILESLARPITVKQVEFANRYWTARGLPFNIDGWMAIARDPILKGRLPLRIQAAPEGTVMKHGHVMVQVVNTDPRFFWLTTWPETKLMRVWYPTTVASLSAAIKSDILAALVKTADAPDDEILYKLHDFGSRGVSSEESAGIGGSAHLLNFIGSDTGKAGLHAMEFYNAPIDGVDSSLSASEHSTITSWGKENELAAYENMLNKFGHGLVAVVSDSYDIYNAVKNLWGGALKQRVIEMVGMLIVRPDSGNPETVPLEIVKLLDEAFGHVINTKGYKVLNHVRVIQGDGINKESIAVIMQSLIDAGYSISNIAFGMGGALLQGVNRDTMGFAMKASAAMINGVWVDVFKDPVTDKGKRSKKGRLALIIKDGEYTTVREDSLEGWALYPNVNKLRTVFLNGYILVNEEWKDVVGRARS
jgi:nicotinamide phosphoribosyltransferase